MLLCLTFASMEHAYPRTYPGENTHVVLEKGQLTSSWPGKERSHQLIFSPVFSDALNHLYNRFETSQATTLTCTKNDVSCPGGKDGSIDLDIPSTKTVQSILWEDGNGYSETTEDIFGLTAGNYTVTVTYTDGTSETLTVTIDEPVAPLTISTQPANTTACAGSVITFNVVVSGGSGSYTFTWQRKKPNESTFTDIPASETNVIYPTPGEIQIGDVGNSDAPDGAQYQVMVSDGCSMVASTPVPLTVNRITGIIASETTPSESNVTICGEDNFSYTVTTSGTTPVSYQWKKYNNSLGTWEDILDGGVISGATTNQLTFTAATTAESGEYLVVVTFPLPAGTTCELGSDTIPRELTVLQKQLQAPVISSDQVICPGSVPAPLTATAASGGSGTYNYQWQSSADSINWSDITGETNLNYSPPALTDTTYYQLVVTDPGLSSCATDLSNIIQVAVYPEPTVINPGDQTYCQGEQTPDIPLTGYPAGVTFNITGGAAVGLYDKTWVTKIPSFTASNAGTATVSITPWANGCSGVPINFTITVTSLPNVSVAPPLSTICSGESTNISLSSPPPASTSVTFSWTVTDITPASSITGASAGNGTQIAQTLVNTTTTNATVTYQVTPKDGNCPGIPVDVEVTVLPPMTATIQADGTATACQTDASSPTITFTGSGGATPYTFTYNINNGANQTVTTSSGNSVTINAPTTSYGVFNYNLLGISDSKHCSNPGTGTATVIINPLPVLSSTLTPSGICNNDLFSYTPTCDISGTTFEWTRAEVPGISDAARTESGAINEHLENTTNNPVAVTYTFTLTSPEGCVNTQDVVVVVTRTPHLTSTYTPDPICGGTLFSYEPTSEVSGTIFPWKREAVPGISNPSASGTGNPNEVLINTTSIPQAVVYEYTLSSNDCVNPVTFPVQVVVKQVPEVTAWASENGICVGESIDLFSSSNLAYTNLPDTLFADNFEGSGTGWTKTWDDSQAAWTIQNDNYKYKYGWWNSVTFRSNDHSHFFLSNSHPVPYNGPWWIPAPWHTSTLTSPAINTAGYTSLELSYWQYYEDGASQPEIRVSTDKNNWTTIETIYNDEGSPTHFSKKTIPLDAWVGNPAIYIQFYYTYRVGNNPYWWAIDNVNLTGESPTADMFWTSNPPGFTSTEPNPTSIIPTDTTTYIATYTDPDTGCSGSDSVTVNVYPEPNVVIDADYCAIPGYVELSVTESYVDYLWNTGETTPTIKVNLVGEYSVTVTDANGCTGTGSLIVSNELVVNGDFSMGNTGFTTPATAGNHYTYVNDIDWKNDELTPEGLYGIGSNAHNYHNNFWGVDHTTGDGNFMIVNGFPGSPQPIVWQQTYTVEPNTEYYFSAWAISLNNAGNYAELRFSINGTQIGTTANLTAGTGSDANPWKEKDHFYGIWTSGSATTTAVVSIVDLQTAPGGNDFGLDDISFGTLVPSFFSVDTVTSNSPVCSGDDIELETHISGGKAPITYSWSGPDGFSSTEANPVIPNATLLNDGDYKVIINDGFGCPPRDTTITVSVFPAPTVDAGNNNQFVCEGDPTVKLNGTIGGSATSGTWSGGNGTFTPDAGTLDAEYTLSAAEIAAGTVTLTLTTNAPSGPCSPVSDAVTITVNPAPKLSLTGTDPLCHGGNDGTATVTATDGTPPYTYLWSNGQTTPTAIKLYAGNYSVTVTDTKGCEATDMITLSEPATLTTTITGSLPQCKQSDGIVTVTVTGGVPPYTYSWKDSYGNVIATSSSATGLPAGTYSITVTDYYGCERTTNNITIPSVNDATPPVFSEPAPMDECVEPIHTAIYYAPTMGISGGYPDYYTFVAGDTRLDIDPTTMSDNCCAPDELEIRWRIDFADGTGIPSSSPTSYITGQPSTFGSNIVFPGDVASSAGKEHTITYWVVDCNYNVSTPQTTKIEINPRPTITKQP